MVDISVEILASSVPIGRDDIKYKVKTWWAHVDFEDGKNLIRLPGLPMIEHYFNMTGKDTTVFIEMWYRNDDICPPPGDVKFLGMAKCQVDEQLKDSKRNPSVVWLEVYDPIEDIVRGRILLKVDAKFTTASVPAPELFPVAMDLTAKTAASGVPSSYFNQNQDPFQSPSTIDSSPSKRSVRSVTIQTDSSTTGSPSGVSSLPFPSDDNDNKYPSIEDKNTNYTQPPQPTSTQQLLSSKPPQPKVSRFHQEMEKACKDKVNQTKKSGDKGNPFHVRVYGKTYTIQVDNGNGVPKVVTAKSTKKVTPPTSHRSDRPNDNDKAKRSSNVTKFLSPEAESSTSAGTGEDHVNNANEDDSVEDVIHLLNDNFDKLLLGNTDTTQSTKKELGKVGQTSSSSEWTHSASSGSTAMNTVNPEILRLRRQQMDRVISESDSSLSPPKFPGRLAPEGQNETETDASDFSPMGPSRMNLGILGLGFKPQHPGALDVQGRRDRDMTSHNQSSRSPVMQIKRVEDSKCSDTVNGRPPRSKRMAAAIFND